MPATVMRSAKNQRQHQRNGGHRTAAARTESSAGAFRPWPSGEVPVLPCGHPGLPSNLKNGLCGTCQCADEFDQLSRTIADPALKARTAEFAARFRSGAILYDASGQTYLEMTGTARPRSNGRPGPA